MKKLIAYKYFVPLLLMILFLISCKKDENKHQPNGDFILCESFPAPFDITSGYNWLQKGNQYRFPQAYNENEFIYYWFNSEDAANQIFEIANFNLSTKEKTILAKGFKLNELLTANKYGDVLFNDFQSGVYLISDGKITKPPIVDATSFPNWIEDRKYGFQRGSTFYINDINHNNIDSIEGLNRTINKIDVNKEHLAVVEIQPNGNDYGVYTFDLISKELKLIKSLNYSEEKQRIKSIKWHPRRPEFYYIDGNGVFRFNISTMKEDVLYRNCDNISFESFSLSPDEKILIHLQKYERVDTSTLNAYSFIYKMTDDGKNIERVF